MKQSLIPALRCLKCGKSDFELAGKGTHDTEAEIRYGYITCRKCSTRYDIDEGIVKLLYNVQKGVAEQQKIIREVDRTTGEGGGFAINSENLSRYKGQFLSLPEGDGTELYARGAFKNVSTLADYYYSFVDKLDITGKENILEIGADSTWSVNKFAAKGCNCIALDINHHLIAADLYFESCNTYYERVMADMNALPFKDNTFDIVFCSQVLHHSNSLKGVLQEIYRVLKPGGRAAIFSEPVLGLLFFWRKLFYGYGARKCGITENAYTLYEFLKAVIDTGFSPEMYFSVHQRYNKFRKCKSIFEAPAVRRLLVNNRFYPLMVLEPYKVDFIAYKAGKGNKTTLKRPYSYINNCRNSRFLFAG